LGAISPFLKNYSSEHIIAPLNDLTDINVIYRSPPFPLHRLNIPYLLPFKFALHWTSLLWQAKMALNLTVIKNLLI